MVFGQVISVLGSALLRFALSLYILDATGDETLFATMYAVSNIPMLLTPLGGAIADRFNRRNLMVIFDFTSGAIALSLTALMASDYTPALLLGAVMVMLSIVGAMYTPAVTASIPSLVGSEKLEGANGLVQAVQALSSVAAPILGGILYGAAGVKVVAASGAAAFILSAIMEIFIKIPYVKITRTEHIIPTIAKDMKEGFAYIIGQKFILKAGVVAVLINLVLSPYFVVGVPIVLRVTMKSGDALYGAGMAIIYFAAIVGALSVGFFAKKMSLKKLYILVLLSAFFLFPMAISLFPFILKKGVEFPFVIFMLGAFPIAVIMTLISVWLITKVQKITPNEKLGKVMAIMMAVSQLAAPLGQIIYGVVFGKFGNAVYIPTFIVCGAVLLLSLLTRFLMKNETN